MTDEKEYSQNEVNIMTNEMIALRKEYERAACRRGAEAMREAAACWLDENGTRISLFENPDADEIRALPTPEYTDAP